ncbi:MAG: SpoIIE family protein phosphatase [Thermoanaerobaculia bacterium]
MPKTRTIRQRLLADQTLLILVLGATLLATTFIGARRALEALSRDIIDRAGDQAETELRRFFDPVAGGLLALRAWGRAGLLESEDPRRFMELVSPLATGLPQISGVLVADGRGREDFLVRTGDRDDGWRSRRTRRDEWGQRSQWLDWPNADGEPETSWEDLDYDPRQRPWFRGAVAARAAASSPAEPAAIYWTEPYRFFTHQRPGITAAVAYDPGDGIERVVAIDVLLDDLTRFSRTIEVSERGSLWVLTGDRRLLAWPDDPDLWQGRDPATAALRSPRELGLTLVDDALAVLAAQPSEARGEPVRFTSGGEDWWSSGRSFELSAERSLSIAVAVPLSDLLAERTQLRRWVLILTVLALLAAMARAVVLAGRFSKPIEALVVDSGRISQGDLEPGRPIVTPLTEVRRLADAHDQMRRGLRTLMKLERDLQLARQIQQNTFPRELPELEGFDLVAWNQPADETGGDSYDVVGLDDDGRILADQGGKASRAVLMLADATGHGIGPALSVTQLRAMLRMALRLGSDLLEIAGQMNEQIFADLPTGRFITTWLGELRVETRTLTTFSAGQAPLLLYQAATDRIEVFRADVPPMGLMQELVVDPPAPIEIAPGDVYAVLSDGFFEAVDGSGMEFGQDRVIEVIRQHGRAGAAEILAALRASVREFTGSAPFDDDRTAVIIKGNGAPG